MIKRINENKSKQKLQARFNCPSCGTRVQMSEGIEYCPSELLIDGRLMRTAANSAILYTPGSRIYYRAAGEEYRNDWIHISIITFFIC